MPFSPLLKPNTAQPTCRAACTPRVFLDCRARYLHHLIEQLAASRSPAAVAAELLSAEPEHSRQMAVFIGNTFDLSMGFTTTPAPSSPKGE